VEPADATKLIHAIPFVERTGMVIEEVEPGRCVLSIPEEPNVNHFGTVYAGAIYTLGEVPGGVLFFATFDGEKYFPLVKSSQIRYRRPGRGRLRVEATIEADEVARLSAVADAEGKADYTLELEITDETGDVVALMTSQYQMRTHGSLS
jgi:thioesterase domain-containing protein